MTSAKKSGKSVNIFHKHISYLTHSLSTLCKTYCFAFQKRRFCTVKAALLSSKRAAFAMPNRNYRFLNELSLQNKGYALLFQSKNSTNRNSCTLTVKMWLRWLFSVLLTALSAQHECPPQHLSCRQ
ncbi:hypothetical protein CTM62_05465 [Prevotella intermedia]|uniref:Uncharacterized protein n=1 Tax=Prevotella intermedia TaxID=28131 RepID=A0A2D3L6K8_PREIN|nr:hypothetical protein CTM62_05465 [Prevotella intermedia]